MTVNSHGLTADQSILFLEVIDASLRITRREQFFSWLQGCFQYLFPHEVLICGTQTGGQQAFHFEHFVSTRYLTDRHVANATRDDGLVGRVIAAWQQSPRPAFLAEGVEAGDYGAYVVPFQVPVGALREAELKNLAAHGLANRDGSVSTFFCFSRLPGVPGPGQAYLLELLVPHLHAVLIRVLGSNGTLAEPAEAEIPITLREREILQWLHQGKTNWEIAGILDISPLTVKNHVQNILRKLNVQNRSHAVVKATQMGLV